MASPHTTQTAAPTPTSEVPVTVGGAVPVADLVPPRLSPSRLTDFQQCPAKFFYRSILKLGSPATVATTKGTLVHAACEYTFDVPAGQRTPKATAAHIRPVWENLSGDDSYAPIAALDPAEQEAMLVDAERLAENWYLIENPNRFTPTAREQWVHGTIAATPIIGVIDRVDDVTYPSGAQHIIISDYKTGKPARANDRFLDDKFFAMQIYALLLSEARNEPVFKLRLIYLQGQGRDAVVERDVTTPLLTKTRKTVEALVTSIRQKAKAGEFPAKKQVLCNWCDYQHLCPVWEPAHRHTDHETLVELHRNKLAADAAR